MFANELVALVEQHKHQIKDITGYDNRVNYIEGLVVEYNKKNQLDRIKLAARASLEASFNYVYLEKESDIIITVLKLRQTENSFTYKEEGFTSEMLDSCRGAVKTIRNIICHE